MRLVRKARRLAAWRLVGPVLAALVLAGCGGSDADNEGPSAARDEPVLGGRSGEAERPTAQPTTEAPSFPASATKNTTRVDGTDPVASAAHVALAVFPARSRETRPAAVTLVDRRDWRTAISAAQLMSRPVRAPVLLSQDGALPPATASTLKALAPTGAPALDGAQVIRIGRAAAPTDAKLLELAAGDYAEQARAIDRAQTAAAGKASRAVLIAPAEDPGVAMPAAGWAAKSGTPVLWVTRSQIPAATRAAIRDHGRPRIYLLGPESAISPAVARRLSALGTVKRIAGRDAIETAVAFARYAGSGFGWNAVDPGHGFVFTRSERPLQAAAAAPLSASGTYGPLLLIGDGRRLDRPVEQYLLDVQPGYESDPVRGVYNHGWLVGDVASISIDVQSRIDALLEIQPVDSD